MEAANAPTLTVALSLAFASLAHDPAWACRGQRLWSTGANLEKLRPGEIVVKATLLESYKSEQPSVTTMGMPYGMIYHVEVVDVVGGAADTNASLLDKSKIFIRLKPAICEQYFPRDFGKGAQKILVLKKGDAGLYDLVGGQE